MSSGQQPSSQQSSPPTWTEPPWCGWIETTGDALLILEAARRGLIPRVTRRLVDSERKMITSGSVFVFDEDESGIKRWTDGFFWSPSRILGNFLLYRETDKRGAGHRSIKADQELNGESSEGQSLSRSRSDVGSLPGDKNKERLLVGSLTNSYKFKPDGLMKKTFSLTIGGVAQHLISYYKIEDVQSGRLRSPSSLPELASLEISPEYLDKTHFRSPPKVEIDADGKVRYCGEADDIDISAASTLLTGPLSSSSIPPLLTEGRMAESSSKRGKRFDPVPAAKRPRKNAKSTQQEAASPGGESASSPVAGTSTTPIDTAQSSTPGSAYPDANVPMSVGMPPAVPHGYTPPYGMPAFYPGYPPGHIYGPPAPGTVPQPGVGMGLTPYPPAPVAASPSTSMPPAQTPQPGAPATTQYTPYPPGYPAAPPGAAVATSTKPMTPSDPSQVGLVPTSSAPSQPGSGARPLPHGGQMPYHQNQQQYYSYYPHPAHMQPHTYPPPVHYQWGQYAYPHAPLPPPPPPSHQHHPSMTAHSQPPPAAQPVVHGHSSAATPYQPQGRPQAQGGSIDGGRDDESA